MKQVSQTPVSLSPGDVIEIKFFYTPQLDELQTVRPDGNVTLQLIGELNVQGKTPDELRRELVKLYSPRLTNPEIAVFTRSFYNRRVFVGGQVMNPGVIEIPGNITALGAIMEAGGFDMRQAEAGNVIVIRHKDGKRYGYSLNLKDVLEGKPEHPFLLEAQDIVYVPRTKIAKAGQWVDQHINDLIPRTGFYYSNSTGDSTIGIQSRY